ncbi:peptidase S1 [Rugosibacter aromaticivorans]|uniref:Peptidase S1 n=1 Tax=Rugosibacter aromaticivorans TaxID=1565605 RepID=A0A0C5J117_9PROT|nr:serine protease [Rugosibacter aromaticivorans]AJP48792.1 peptidase S1 [Rugosibacter aromaticivorans]TBR15204.1 MAG: serine protease [Rugosibacter sp.]
MTYSRVEHRISRRLLVFAATLALALTIPTAQADLPETVTAIKPSIVVVGTFSQLRSPSFLMRGTGFALGDGSVIATNAHVIPPALDAAQQETLAVLVRQGDELHRRNATLQVTDADHDLALLRISGPPLPALKIKSAAKVREGQAVAFIGFPIGGSLGFSPVTHRGIISSITPIALPAGNSAQLKEKPIRRLRSGSFSIYQLDATAYPGNSGGPLFDVNTGEVVGILNMVFVKGTKESVLEKPSGISYAIPASFLQGLIAHTPP